MFIFSWFFPIFYWFLKIFFCFRFFQHFFSQFLKHLLSFEKFNFFTIQSFFTTILSQAQDLHLSLVTESWKVMLNFSTFSVKGRGQKRFKQGLSQKNETNRISISRVQFVSVFFDSDVIKHKIPLFRKPLSISFWKIS